MNQGSKLTTPYSPEPGSYESYLGPRSTRVAWILIGSFGWEVIRELFGQRRLSWVVPGVVLIVTSLGLALTKPPRSVRTKVALTLGFVVAALAVLIIEALYQLHR